MTAAAVAGSAASVAANAAIGGLVAAAPSWGRGPSHQAKTLRLMAAPAPARGVQASFWSAPWECRLRQALRYCSSLAFPPWGDSSAPAA